MLYVGLTMTKETIQNWMGTDYKERLRGLSVQVNYMDKSVYCVGIPIQSPSQNVWAEGNTFSSTLAEILKAYTQFYADMQTLELPLHNVTIDFVESGSEVRALAEPTLIEWIG